MNDHLSASFRDACTIGALCVDHWGAAHQIDKAVEEMAELIVALQHYKEERITGGTVRCEIADVLIMSAQLTYIFGSDRVDASLQDALKRLGNRLAKSKTEERRL